MRRVPHIVVAALLIVLAAANSYPADKEGFQFRRQPELQQIKPKKPVKIKLKRTAKDEYSWELSGDDADEIVRTDRKLKKMLNIK
jgi:hypothetical protein